MVVPFGTSYYELVTQFSRGFFWDWYVANYESWEHHDGSFATLEDLLQTCLLGILI